MIRTSALAFAVVAAVALPAIAPAFAKDDHQCGSAARESWQSQDAIKAKFTGLGYQVRRVKVEGSCYELYAITKEGAKQELIVHPVSGEIVATENED